MALNFGSETNTEVNNNQNNKNTGVKMNLTKVTAGQRINLTKELTQVMITTADHLVAVHLQLLAPLKLNPGIGQQILYYVPGGDHPFKTLIPHLGDGLRGLFLFCVHFYSVELYRSFKNRIRNIHQTIYIGKFSLFYFRAHSYFSLFPVPY